MFRIRSLPWLVLLSLPLFLPGCGGEDVAPERFEKFDLEAAANGSTYTINVALPEDYATATGTYATIYVLDGDPDFSTTARLSAKLSAATGNQNLIVVGIMNYGPSGRAGDYTPTKDSKQGGGDGEAFLTFLTKELMPAIEAKYRAAPTRSSRIIMGHSFGGLLGTFAFTNFNEYFGNYLLLSPSLIWDNQVIFELEAQHRAVNSSRRSLIYQGYGEMELLVIPLPNKAFHRRLEKYYPLNRQTIQAIEGKEHISSRNRAIEGALGFYFNNKF